MDETRHTATFDAPIFASRVLAARMLIEASGKRFVWDEARGEYVLSDERMSERAVK